MRYNQKLDPENYFREQLLLFLPWRNEHDLLNGYNTYSEHYTQEQNHIQHTRQQYEHSSEILDSVREQVQEQESEAFSELAPGTVQIDDDDAALGVEECTELAFFDPERPENHRNYDIGPDLGLPRSAGTEQVEVHQKRIPDDQYTELLTSLNKEQHEFCTHVMHWIKTKSEPIHAFLSGGAGVGKSVVHSKDIIPGPSPVLVLCRR